MADKREALWKRFWVKMPPETKRRLDHLSVDSGFNSTEAYAGHVLTEAVNRLWRDFDPKKPHRR